MVTAKRARLLGVIMLVSVFSVGALMGAAGLRVMEAEDAPMKARAKPTEPDLLNRLQLTPEQRAQVDVVLERRRAEMEEFWDQHRPLLRAIADSARAELRAVLTPEQQEIEERFMAERRQHLEKRKGNDRW
jgi:Spy/CpxP family protein refolding chaperone